MANPVIGALINQNFLTPSTSWAVTETPDHLIDDIIVAVPFVDGSNYASAASAEWTAIGIRTGTPAGSTFCQAWYHVATTNGTGEAPTFTISGSDDGYVALFILRGIDTASVVDVVSVQTDWNSVATHESATVDPTNAGCLLIYLWSSDGSVYLRTDLTDASMLSNFRQGNGSVTGLIAYRQHEPNTASSAVTMVSSTAAEGGTSWVIAFKNASSGALAPDVRSDVTKINEYGTTGSALTWYGPAQVGNLFVTGLTALNSINLSTAASVTEAAQYEILTTTTTTNQLDGAWHAYSGNLDGKIFSAEFQTSRPGIGGGGRIGTEGLLVGFTDGTNYEFHRIMSSVAQWSALTWYRAAISCGNTTPTYYSGSVGDLDWTAITGICYLLHHEGTTADTLWVKDAYSITSFAITGGGASRPSTFSDIPSILSGHIAIDFAKLQGGSQTMPLTSIQIGDGTNTTYFDASAAPVSYPATYANKLNFTTQGMWNVPSNAVSINVKAKSGDTINLTATSIYSVVKQTFTIDAASSAGATYLTTGLALIGYDVTDNLGIGWNGATFKSGGTVTIAGGGDLTNCTIAKTTSTNAALAITANGSTLDGTTIDGTGAAYALELGTAVTAITLPDCTITTGSTAKIHVLATTGTVTITIGGSTVSPTYVSEGAAVDISAPVNTADISITGMPDTTGANNRLQIINTTAISAADWTANTPYTAGDVVLRTSGIGSENTAGLYFRATTGGTSHVTTEPTWGTTVGNTTTDGTVVWTTYAILYYDADPAATSLTDTYIDGEEFKAGETIEIRFAEEDPAVSFKIYSTSVIAATTGFSALVIEDDDSSYATYATSGVMQDSIFSPNFVANYIVLDTDTNFTASGAYAYYCYLLTTSEGMYRFWGGLTGIDPGNIRNNASVVSLYFDCSSGFVRQTDDIRIFRSDGLRPALDPVTADGGGIEINWKVPVNVVSTGGSALTPTESAQLMALPSASTTATAVGARTVEGTFSEDEILKLLAAALAGKREGIGTATETYTGLDGTTPRISLTPDANGNGTPVLDVT